MNGNHNQRQSKRDSNGTAPKKRGRPRIVAAVATARAVKRGNKRDAPGNPGSNDTARNGSGNLGSERTGGTGGTGGAGGTGGIGSSNHPGDRTGADAGRNDGAGRIDTDGAGEYPTPELAFEDSARIKGKRGRKPKVDHKRASITLLSTGLSSLFGIVAAFEGEHWYLQDFEAQLLSAQLDQALSTLPEEYYASVNEALEKYAPWVALAFTSYAIVRPRLDASAKRRGGISSPASAGGRPYSDNGKGASAASDLAGN